MRKTILLSAAAALVAASLASGPTEAASGPESKPAQSLRKPAVTLNLSANQVQAGAPMSVSISGKGFRKKHKIVLERTAGTAGSFIKVTKLPRSGSKVVTAPPQGISQFRATVKKKTRNGKSKVLTRTAPQTVYSYSDVSLSTICGASDAIDVYYCSSGSKPSGSNTFVHEAYSYGTTDPNDADRTIEATGSSCRSIAIQYANSNDSLQSSSAPTTMNVALRQEAADLQSSSAPVRTVGSATFGIGSPSWSVNMWSTGGNYGSNVYYRATLSCYTPDGDA